MRFLPHQKKPDRRLITNVRIISRIRYQLRNLEKCCRNIIFESYLRNAFRRMSFANVGYDVRPADAGAGQYCAALIRFKSSSEIGSPAGQWLALAVAQS